MANKKEITHQEKAFLEFLFDGESLRHPDEAKQMAGYDKSYPTSKILDNVTEELIARCDKYLAMYAPKGIVGLINIINDPSEPGAKVKLAAIIDLLDRAGVVKKEKTEVVQAQPHYMFVLPSKASETINEIKEN